MNSLAGITVILLLPVLSASSPAGAIGKEEPRSEAVKNWRLGIQAYSFRLFTFYEAVDKTASLGLDCIEAYSFGQVLSKEKPDIKFNHTMPAAIRNEVKRKLAGAGVKLVNYYALLPNDQAECRKVFDFAKDMGIRTIVSEPPEESLDMIEKLCKEYEIKLAIHNHPRSSKWNRYWDPQKVLDVCKGRSEWIGACGDTGHWLRSGVNPVEALKKLQSRIICLHLKDLNEFGDPNAHDVIWGTGKGDIKGVLAELKRQDFKGVISIEYEHDWKNSMPEIAECIKYFDRVSSELGCKRKQ